MITTHIIAFVAGGLSVIAFPKVFLFGRETLVWAKAKYAELKASKKQE